MKPASTIRKAYEAVALFALLNGIALASMAIYLIVSGVVGVETLQEVVAVVQGKPDQELPPVIEKIEPDPTAQASTITPRTDGNTQWELELMRREAERIEEELRQRLALNNSILLRIATERARFQEEREDAAKYDQAMRQQHESRGFKKQVDIYQGLAPKTALKHLFGMDDPDGAARILLEMKTNRAKKIVEVAKKPDEMVKMQEILRRIRETEPEKSAELGKK